MAEKKGEEKCQLLEIILKGIGIKRKLMANINGLEEIVMREVLWMITDKGKVFISGIQEKVSKVSGEMIN